MQPELTLDRIEAAIEWYERIVNNPHWGTVGIEWEHVDTALEALKATIQALQKQLVDRIPCEWCDVYAHSTARKYNYCPNCGRRLPEANHGAL